MPCVLLCCIQLLSQVWLFATLATGGFSVHRILHASIQEWVACPPPGIFSTQGSNPHLLHYRRILYCWATGETQMGHVKVKVAQVRLTLCDPMDYTVHGILQARILEWVAVPFSRGSSQPRDGTQVSRIAGGFFTSWATREAQEYWSGSLSLLQQIFLTQESNWGLLHCRQILYQLSYQERPKWNSFSRVQLFATP